MRLEWNRRSARFSRDEQLICGVRTTEERYKQHFTRELCPDYPHRSAWWAAYTHVEPPGGEFWEGENLKEYRGYLVETILKGMEGPSSSGGQSSQFSTQLIRVSTGPDQVARFVEDRVPDVCWALVTIAAR